jgi:hypothetical protein
MPGYSPPHRKSRPSGGDKGAREAAARRAQFLEVLPGATKLREVLDIVGVTDQTYRSWRKRHPQFAYECDKILARKQEAGGPIEGAVWQRGFEEFRWHFFDMDTPLFQRDIIEAYETTPLGNITLILVPPAHGKTSLFEDYASYKLAVNPEYRFTVGCETAWLSKKILGRVKNRMEPYGPFPPYVAMFGPFAPTTKAEGNMMKARQPWSDDRFNVFKKTSHDERDFSMVALGMNSQVAGTRTDHLHADDVQSLNNINQTQTLIEKFRQDWLSRPAEEGRTTINGTRVDEGDFYEALEEELNPDILRVIRLPAIIYTYDHGYQPLWPRSEEHGNGYTMEMLDRLRAKVGEDAWARNYMQQPRARSHKTFTTEAVEQCFNPLRSVIHDPKPGSRIVIGLDPSIGGINAFSVCALESRKLILLDIVEHNNLSSVDAIMNVLEEICHQYTTASTSITNVIIETMAFQKGLVQDERLKRIQKRFGFQVHEHLTGLNKYDENIGVPSMVTNFLREEIDLPYAADPATRRVTEEFARQLYAWRPKARGTKLRQDQVMAFWFVWIFWREQVRRFEVERTMTDVPAARGLPWKPTVFSSPTKYAGVR